MKKLNDKQLQYFLKDTVVKGKDGLPLLVYRGEHGVLDQENPGLQTRLGSYSFSNPEIASVYAENPNNKTESPIAEQPRIYPAYLRIKNAFCSNPAHPDDPFVDFTYIEKTLGTELAVKFFLKYSDYAENTNNWQDEINGEREFEGVKDFYAKCPARMGELYADIYPFLDDPEFIEALKAKGFDGAEYGGSGANFLANEYRVFDACNIVFALTNEIAAAPIKTMKAEPAEMAL